MRAFLALLVAFAAACSSAPSQEQCESLLGNLIDLELQKGGGKNVTADMKADLEKQKKAIADYTREKFMDACMKKTAKAVVECGTHAKTDKELSACDETEGK
ncbi:MAG TPA: hypothetical protein VL463_20010 [Kofleriaceae bacterium]|nr:hypothetical protein [Kofleriaceae bacterium]